MKRQFELINFINKDTKIFLKKQFKLWLYQYFWDGGKEWDFDRVNQLQILKDIAYKIIDFISQFEEELKKIWLKPKFVKNSNYVITLDRIVKKEGGLDVLKKILNHKGIDEQIKEWKELEIVDEGFDKNEILISDVFGDKLNEKYQFLPIDTKYFKDLELEILGLFDDLDNELDGWLIKSENFQALNTILPKFKEKVQTIYIDPPFNKEQDADYFYNVKYKDSTWATMLENRLRLARDFLKDTGSIFVRCDYNGNWIVRALMDEIFGKENFRNEIVIRRTTMMKRETRRLEVEHETLFNYSKIIEKSKFNLTWEDIPHKWAKMPTKYNKGGPTGKPIIIGDKKFEPPEGYSWAIGNEIANEMYKNGRLKIENDNIYVLFDKRAIGTNWLDIPGYSTNWKFQTENSETLLKRVIKISSDENDLIMDFFLGSGTTTAVAHKLRRKWIGIEMGEHFYNVVLPRMKKVLAYDNSGISKEKEVKRKYNEKNAGGFFEYYKFE